MDFYKLFYFMTVGDKLGFLFGALSVIGSIVLAISGIVTHFVPPDLHHIDENTTGKDWKSKENYQISTQFRNAKNTFRVFSFLVPIFLILWAGSPTKKEAVLIVAGGYVGNFITSDSSAKRLPSDIAYFLRTQLQVAAKESEVELQNLIRGETKKDTVDNMTVDQLKEYAKKLRNE